MSLDRAAFKKIADADFEFGRETRYLTGSIVLEMGDAIWSFDFDNGKLKSISDQPRTDAKIVVGGSSHQWDALLEEMPKPFYQCIQSAAVKEGMMITDTNETFAYLPALNRMTTLLRQMKNGKA